MNRAPAVRRLLPTGQLRRAAIPLVALALLATACGDSGGGITSDEGTAESPTAAVTDAESPTEGGDAAAGDDAWADVVAAAEQEGEVIAYVTFHEDQHQPLIDAFNEEYPNISVTLTRGDSGAVVSRLSSEIEAGATTADLVQLGDTILMNDEPQWFADQEPDLLPSMAEYPDRLIEEKVAHNVATLWQFSFNTNRVDAPIENWEEMSSMPYLDQGMFSDPRVAMSWTAWWAFMRDNYGVDFVQTLVNDSAGLVDSTTAAAQMLIAGEVAFATPNLRHHTAEGIAAGAPVDRLAPDPEFGMTYVWALLEEAEHPNAARVFLDFVFSRRGVEVLCGEGDYQPFIYDDIEACPQAAEDVTLVTEFYPLLTEEYRSELFADMGIG